MPMSAVEEGDKLDRAQAQQVLRRAARMLRPYRRDVRLSILLVVVSTAAVVAGPYLLKLGIDRGISRGSSCPDMSGQLSQNTC